MEIFKDDEYCYSQIKEARELFGSRNTTRKQFEALEKVLGLIYLHNDGKPAEIALSTLDEATIRKFYFETNIWGN